MGKKYYEINQCSYCGKLENGQVGTPEGWFGLDEDGDKVCDDCRDLQQFRATKAKQSAAAKKTNEFLKKNKPDHYRAAVMKRWATRLTLCQNLRFKRRLNLK